RLLMEQERFPESTIARFVEWNRRLIVFHRLRHPQTLADTEIDAFVQQAAPRENDRAEAARAIRFLYNRLLQRQLPFPAGFRESADIPAPAKDSSATQPRLLDRARQILRTRGYAWRTEESYVHWIVRYVLFHNKRQPLELGAAHIEAFLTDLVVRG